MSASGADRDISLLFDVFVLHQRVRALLARALSDSEPRTGWQRPTRRQDHARSRKESLSSSPAAIAGQVVALVLMTTGIVIVAHHAPQVVRQLDSAAAARRAGGEGAEPARGAEPASSPADAARRSDLRAGADTVIEYPGQSISDVEAGNIWQALRNRSSVPAVVHDIGSLAKDGLSRVAQLPPE